MTREEAIRQSVIYAVQKWHPGDRLYLKGICETLLSMHEHYSKLENPTWDMEYFFPDLKAKFQELSHDIQG